MSDTLLNRRREMMQAGTPPECVFYAPMKDQNPNDIIGGVQMQVNDQSLFAFDSVENMYKFKLQFKRPFKTSCQWNLGENIFVSNDKFTFVVRIKSSNAFDPSYGVPFTLFWVSTGYGPFLLGRLIMGGGNLSSSLSGNSYDGVLYTTINISTGERGRYPRGSEGYSSWFTRESLISDGILGIIGLNMSVDAYFIGREYYVGGIRIYTGQLTQDFVDAIEW